MCIKFFYGNDGRVLQHFVMVDVNDVILLVYRAGHKCISLLPEMNHGCSSGSDAVAVSKTNSDIGMMDHDSSSSADCKEAGVDVKHFIEV